MNTTTRLTWSLLALLTITACKKDDDADTPTPSLCETLHFGYVTVSNTSTNPYQLRVDNVIVDTIPGNSIIQDMQLNQGDGRHLYALQLSGYVLYPTEVNNTLNVLQCSHYAWQIP